MMNAIQIDDRPPDAVVRDLIDRHGLRPILLALLRLALSRRRAAPPADDRLSDYLRRDIGLPPVPGRQRFWELH
jgi:hypothetical protein